MGRAVAQRSRGDAASRAPRYWRRRAAAALVALAGVAFVVVVVVANAGGSDTHGARVVRFTIDSSLVHQSMAIAAVIPGGATTGLRPLLVFLHGKGENQESNLDAAMFAALARLGPRAPDIVFPYGGADSYWHDRSDGAWAAYVMREVIPQAVTRLGADPTRVAIGGISMGGFGALDIARLNPGRFCAVGGHSPALWLNGGDTAPGAFDDAADFARHDVIAAARAGRAYRGTPLWIDVGTQDPFRAADARLVQTLRAAGHPVGFHVWPGSHDQSYWNHHWNSYLQFYGASLAGCRRS